MVCVGDLCDLVPPVAPEHAVIQGHQGAVCNEPGLIILGPTDGAVCIFAGKPTWVVCAVMALQRWMYIKHAVSPKRPDNTVMEAHTSLGRSHRMQWLPFAGGKQVPFINSKPTLLDRPASGLAYVSMLTFLTNHCPSTQCLMQASCIPHLLEELESKLP